MFSQGLSALMNLLSSEDAPNKVLEARVDLFTTRVVYIRDDRLVLYAPSKGSSSASNNNYEIVLHRPANETVNQLFSLYRTPNLEEAEIRFLAYKDRVSTFIEVAKDMCNINGLQKICDTLNEHPGWTVAHLAAHLGLYDIFKDPAINRYLNSVDFETGMSPLQVALTTQNLRSVTTLVASNCSLEHLDYEGNTVFHFAASTTKDIISVLTQKSQSKCLNAKNHSGHTPLHRACLANKPDCVKALLLAGADANIAATKNNTPDSPCSVYPSFVGHYLQNNKNPFNMDDITNGGTPLHWASSRQVVEALIDMNCHINALNFQEKTPLHVLVERGKLDCVVALLSWNASIDLGDKDGNRPIHLAVKTGIVSIIQALIIFGADLDILNNNGQTARHLITVEQEPYLLYYLAAVGAQRCSPGTLGCTDGCLATGLNEGNPPPNIMGPANRDTLNTMLSVAAMEIASEKYAHRKFPKSGRLLCLDGGGIRGLILVQILLEIEKVCRRPICDCFDWLAGTSTGGILALAIARKKTMKECLCLYFRLKEKAFNGRRPYSSENLENYLKDIFGTEAVMSEIKHPKVMVTGVLADRRPVELHLFRTYTSPSDILGVRQESQFEPPPTPDKQHIWQVGRATGAAPTYFKPLDRYLDGGLISNNPTLDALTEIHEHTLALKGKEREDEASPVTVVVSLGTGIIPVKEIKGVDGFTFVKIWDAAKIVMGVDFLGTLLVDQVTSTDGRIVDRARSWCSSIGVPYFRFSPQMSEEIDMDEKCDKKLCGMLWETKVYMHQRLDCITELADILNRG